MPLVEVNCNHVFSFTLIENGSMVKFLPIDPVVSCSSPTSAKLSHGTRRLLALRNSRRRNCDGHIERKDLDIAQYGKSFSVSEIYLRMLGKNHNKYLRKQELTDRIAVSPLLVEARRTSHLYKKHTRNRHFFHRGRGAVSDSQLLVET